MKELIEEKLRSCFEPVSCEVIDDSARHAGHAGARAGGNSHFIVSIVSNAFEGKNRVERHRMVYDALQEAFSDGMHALNIQAKTPEEVAA